MLKAEEFRRYLEHPEWLRQEILPLEHTSKFVVIDEVQKIPKLLDEVHWLHENHEIQFALCGSSARKVRRGQANLLGGRAIRYELLGFTSAELRKDWSLNRMVNHGYLPRIYLSDRPNRRLNAYVADYLKEEVAAEGLVRNLPVFSNFLNVAALSDAEAVNFSTIARDCGVSSQTIRQYFQILEDTLLGCWLPAYRKRPKRRVAASPKFYFSDIGVVNFLAKRGSLVPGSELFGKAFENWCFHELRAYNLYRDIFADFSYWRLAGGTEVDFIINSMEIAIEADSKQSVEVASPLVETRTHDPSPRFEGPGSREALAAQHLVRRPERRPDTPTVQIGQLDVIVTSEGEQRVQVVQRAPRGSKNSINRQYLRRL